MKKSMMGLVFVGLSLGVGACATSVDVPEESTGSETEAARQFCGGFAGIACPDGYICVDAPGDGCDPNNGGADCGGVCKKAPSKCSYGDPDRTWVSKDPNQCAAILFICAEGQQAFFDDCGCGCETPDTPTCDYSDPNLTWVSKDANQCATIKFYCESGSAFFNDCGCGCDNTSVGTPCGANTCGAGEYCCNESCGICAPEGGFCTQQFCG